MELCTTRANIKVQSCGSQTTYEPVRIALSRGFFTNVARLTREGHYITLDSRQKVSIQFRTTAVLAEREEGIFIRTTKIVAFFLILPNAFMFTQIGFHTPFIRDVLNETRNCNIQ